MEHGRERVLYWIDFDGPRVHRPAPTTGELDVVTLDVRPGSLALTPEPGRLLLAAEHVVADLCWGARELSPRIQLEPPTPATVSDRVRDRWRSRSLISNEETTDELGAPARRRARCGPGADGTTSPSTSACARLLGPLSGAYGREANFIVRQAATTVFPLIEAAPLPLLEDDEEIAFLAEIQPAVEAGFARARQRLAELSPPAELKADHQAVLTYFGDMGDVARRITEAAEANDQQALPALYDESGRPGTTLRKVLSEEGEALFGRLFDQG